MSEFRGVPEEDILIRIESGDSISFIAKEFGCNRSVLWRWLESDEQRSARSARARQLAAMAWDDRAEEEIDAAADPFELAKAKEKAHHYRWRASKIAPRQYGDKLDLNHSGRITVAREMTEEELAEIASSYENRPEVSKNAG